MENNSIHHSNLLKPPIKCLDDLRTPVQSKASDQM